MALGHGPVTVEAVRFDSLRAKTLFDIIVNGITHQQISSIDLKLVL